MKIKIELRRLFVSNGRREKKEPGRIEHIYAE
jgi:hypothetical protein